MGMVIALFLALGAMVVSYALGEGGPVAGLVFFAFLFGGAFVRYTEPLRERFKP
jgi:hypothetical protein